LQIAIYTKQNTEATATYIAEVQRWLKSQGAEVLVFSQIVKIFPSEFPTSTNTFDVPIDLKNASLFVTVGGDGTFLDSVLYILQYQIPVMGINTGRLGFLANVAREEFIPAFQNFFQNKYDIEQRNLLQLETDRNLFYPNTFGLNDFVIHKKDTSSMITVHTYLNGEFLNSYWADGLIVATPTGSTGYSLSCGGPIIFPSSSTFAITPVSPHNLNVRPVIVPDDQVISFEIEGRGTNFLVSLDSRSETVDTSVQLAIKKAPYKLNIIRLQQKDYLDTLRKKMMWGHDERNDLR